MAINKILNGLTYKERHTVGLSCFNFADFVVFFQIIQIHQMGI